MKSLRIFSWFFGAAVFGAAFYAYRINALVGFPDGYGTEYDRAEQKLLYVFVAICCAIGGYSVFLGCSHSPKRRTLKTLLAVLAFAVLVLVTYLIGYFLSLHLDTGGGG